MYQNELSQSARGIAEVNIPRIEGSMLAVLQRSGDISMTPKVSLTRKQLIFAHRLIGTLW